MLNAGLLCDRERLAAVLKNYGLLFRAFLANFVLVPVYGVIAVRLLHINDELATGLLLMAFAPGVPFVVFAGGRKKGGSLGFAIALAFLMPAVSVITIPLTAKLVLPVGEVAHVPIGQFFTTLVLFQLVPLLIGILVAMRAQASAERFARIAGVIALVALVIVLLMLAPSIWNSVLSVYGSRGMLAMLIVVVLSIFTGWFFGGPDEHHRHTLAIATALRNIGLCALIATTDFQNTLVPAAVMTYLVIQAVVSSLVGAYFKRTSKPAAAVPY